LRLWHSLNANYGKPRYYEIKKNFGTGTYLIHHTRTLAIRKPSYLIPVIRNVGKCIAKQSKFSPDILNEIVWQDDSSTELKLVDVRFKQALMARAQKEPELKKMLSSLQQFDKRFKGGFKFVFQVPKKGESPARYDGERTVYLNLVKWLSPQNRAGGNKTLFRSAFHEIMHAALGANPTFRKSYLNKMETAIMSEMKKGNDAGFKSFHNAKTLNDLRASLVEIWKPYVNIAKANGNEYWEASVSPFTDFTHSYMSKYLKAETIKKNKFDKNI